jgi:hypothetical protein
MEDVMPVQRWLEPSWSDEWCAPRVIKRINCWHQHAYKVHTPRAGFAIRVRPHKHNAQLIKDWIVNSQAKPALVHHCAPSRLLNKGVGREAAVADALTLEQRFRKEAEKWDRETAFLSSTPTMVLHDSYQKIMAMGPDIVPIMLRDLRQTRRSWFWALRHLTNENPVPAEDQGNLDKMISAWIAWGVRKGRI